MTFTMDCSGAIISGSEFVISNQVTNFNIYKDCGTEKLFEFVQLPTATTTFNFSALLISGANTLETGVYTIEVIITDLNGDLTKHVACKFIDCNDLSCTLLDNYLTETDKVLAYQGLVLANDCSECSCSKLCKLLNFINTDDTTGCGCS